MRVFVAGASGAIGRPLIAELILQGHTVTGMTRSEGGRQRLVELGADVVQVDALDGGAVAEALRRSKAEVVIDELTALPADPAKMAEAAEGDRRLRVEGGGNLYKAARENGVRRYIQQASGFFLAPGSGLGDESVGMAVEASPSVARAARTYAELEARVLQPGGMEGVALRYGFFYGPGTWYHPEGAGADQVRRGEVPIMGSGAGVWSWVHIEDAAIATVAALRVPAGVYNIVDDDPLPMSRWLPEFALFVGAPLPPKMSEAEALKVAGEEAVYYATKLRGASNEKAKRVFRFRPRRLDWLKTLG